METYLVLKFVHVLAAVVWVGGGLMSTFLTIHAGRDGRRLLDVLGMMAPIGLVMMPASLTVLVTGGALVWLGAWGFAPWIVLALAAAGLSFLTGALFLGPTFGRIGAHLAAGETAQALDQAARLVWPGRIEQAALILVVCLMVLKPGWDGMVLVLALAVVLVSGVALINARTGRPRLA